MAESPTLLVAAHGTDSPAGSATTASLVAAVASARPSLEVALCFLDVASPSLREALDRSTRRVVVVPLLLSTGYHVLDDIPSVVANRPSVRVAHHLGPDPRVVDALVDRLDGPDGGATALVAAPSSRIEARAERETAAALLGTRLGRPVRALTMVDDVRAELARLPAPVRVATYLLAEGRFYDELIEAADGLATVGRPIGAHPALVRLVLARYDSALD